jgi:hypothetical protein
MDEPETKEDSSEYSSSKAPETREEAEEHTSEPDGRLLPGGPLGTPRPTGMSGLDREQVPSEGRPDEKKRSD